MKIGLGISTFNRPKHKELCHSSALKTADNIQIYIAEDTLKDRRGIAKRKNECLQNLKENDFVFLADDDIVFLKEGWAEFFIEASKASGQRHLMFLKETSAIKKISSFDISTKIDISDSIERNFPFIINSYNNCGGCFMFLTKEVIEKVGGFNKEYGIYGFEHAGYSQRIHKAGLTPMGAYLCPQRASEYIYAMDYDFHLPFNKQVKHEPSLKDELHLLSDYLKKNREVYEMDTQIYQPL